MPSKKLDFPDSTGISDEKRKELKNCFTCLKCPATFSHERTLKRHAKLHSNKSAFSCDVCFRSFDKKTQLKLHEKEHTRKKSHKCSICAESFTNSSNLFSHLQTHNSKKLFECTVCGKCFTNRYTLKRHIKTHPLHNNPIQGGKNNIFKKCITCTLPTETSAHKSGSKQHKKLHTKESPFMCEVCFKGFSLELDLNSHMKEHTADKCHQCKICSKTFLHITTLSKHVQNHNDTQFKCTVCEKCFRRRDQLKLHMKVHPSAIIDRAPKHNLEVANLNKPSELLFEKEKENKSPIQLKNANISNQDRKIKTPLCCNLRYRRIFHSQEKPFKCHVCFKGFYRNWNLKLHMKIHSDDKLQKKVQTSASSQQNHSLELSNSINSKSLIEDEAEDIIKKSFISNLFSKSSSYKHKLRQQRKSQSAERPFICDICFKGFYQKAKLKVHMKVHSGEKLFQCKNYSETYDTEEHQYIKPSLESLECEKSFTESSRLKQDTQTCTPSESLISCGSLESNLSSIESLVKESTVDEKISPAIECADFLSSKPPNLEQEKIVSISFSCNLCSKTFPSESTLRQHRESHSNKSPFICNVSNLKLHIRSQDPHEKNVKSEDEKVLYIKCKSNEPFRETTEKDTKVYSIEKENRNKRKIYSEMSNMTSEFFIRNRRIEKDHETKKSTNNAHNKNLISQDACEDQFEILSDNIKCHKGTLFTVKTVDIGLTKEKPFQCKFCNKTYSKARKLKNHEKKVHMGKKLAEKTLQCKFCSKKYSSKKKLRKHKKRHSIGKDSNLEDSEFTDPFFGSVVQAILKK